MSRIQALFAAQIAANKRPNRRMRPVGDMALARAESTGQRFYSFSAQIQRERKDYYDQLEATQKGPLDVTPWLGWFLGRLLLSARNTVARGVDRVPVRTNFEIGRHVVAHEQQGERRAKYEKEVQKRQAASDLLPASGI